ncbi:MAG: MmgE/PrpD family protein [Gammaproteobacteria bacterium]|nr:MmgE/PrpD family protein [Gammaproteobacteria bacterium]
MTRPLTEFIRELCLEDVPGSAIHQATLCLLDLIGVAAAGRETDLSRIIHEHVTHHFGCSDLKSRLMFDGRHVSPSGMALAGGMTIDSFDAHDGHPLTKGHAGVAVLPALLGFADARAEPISAREFLTCMLIGYEISIRAGIALHSTVADYHTSGAWNALGAAAIGARLLALEAEQTRHALGIAEYHGPRSQMMRCIDRPSMLKDGSGWGAMAGLSAAYLASNGFTGAPAITCEGEEALSFWSDLGDVWLIEDQYFKPYPVCRWAQPAVEAVASLVRQHNFRSQDVHSITINTFHEAVRLQGAAPRNTEEAQYSIAFPVAAMIARGAVGRDEITADALTNSEILGLAQKVKLKENVDYSAQFPHQRLADLIVHLESGDEFASGTTSARGDPETPLSEQQIIDKFFSLCEPLTGYERAKSLEHCVTGLAEEGALATPLIDLLLCAPGKMHGVTQQSLDNSVA